LDLLILASASPRRSQLLAAAGFEFETVRPEIAERTDPHMTARELTAWNAMRKGLAVARCFPNRVILAADTLVTVQGEIIGKPSNLAHAAKILRRLSGRAHQVFSAVFIARLRPGRIKLCCGGSRVTFQKLSDRKIRSYLAKIDPMDKAGAYAAQGYGAEIIARIDGSYSNVVGLPMEETIAALKQFGIQPAKSVSPRLPSPGRPRRAGAGVRGAGPGRGTRR
jgi:septum formation protein